MKRSFKLKGKTFSINQMFYPTKKIKTPEARDWETKVLWQLNNPEIVECMKDLRSAFDELKHVFHVHIVAVYPRADFITKAGIISAKTQDCSNFEKPLVDLLFLPKHFDTPSPYGAPNLNCDDKFITRLLSEKRAGDENGIEITIEVVDRS